VKRPVWLLREVVEALHAQLAQFGGAVGIRDAGLLASALARPENLLAYGKPTIVQLAAAYCFGLVKNHPFVDGNKRVAFLAAATFLAMNGAPIPESPDWEVLILGVADSTSGREDLSAAFAQAMGGDVAVEADE
jgi:death-on-curing protein